MEKDLFPWLGAMRLDDIAAPMLLDTLRRIETRGASETAHTVRQTAGQVFRYGIATGRCTRNPAGDLQGALNRDLAVMLDTIREKIGFLARRIIILPRRAEDALAEHRAVLDALQRGDGALAQSCKSPVVDVLAYGQVPSRTVLHFMAGPASAVESITGLASGGCQLCLFSTGVGNPIGHPVSTVVKVSGNRNTLTTMPDNVDFDATGVLEQGRTVKALGGELLAYVLSVASGEHTTSELLDTRESAISRFGISM
jgi:hypothetical protein